jgi:rhodanese-related sulfurtransferase
MLRPYAVRGLISGRKLIRRDTREETPMALQIGREQVRGLMARGAQIVDVLPAREYGEDHLPGAINLPLRKIETEAVNVLDRARAVVVYCADSA